MPINDKPLTVIVSISSIKRYDIPIFALSSMNMICKSCFVLFRLYISCVV